MPGILQLPLLLEKECRQLTITHIKVPRALLAPFYLVCPSVPCLLLDSFSVESPPGLFHRYSVLRLGSLLPASSAYLSLVSQLMHYFSPEALLFPSWLCASPLGILKHPAFFLSEAFLECSNTPVVASRTIP